MYDDLIKRLMECASGECFNCSQYTPTTNASVCSKELMKQAADAIEELIAESDIYRKEMTTEHNRAVRLLWEKEHGMPRWIPVTERCPEKSGDYLVFDDCRNLYVNEWHCLLKKWQYDDSRITHWMPLPEPPKEET